MLPTLNFFVRFKQRLLAPRVQYLGDSRREAVRASPGRSGRGAQRLLGLLCALVGSFLVLLLPVVLLEVLPAGVGHEAPVTLDGPADQDGPGRLLQLETVQPYQRVVDDPARLAVERALRGVLAVAAAQDDRDEPPRVIVHARIGVAAADLVQVDSKTNRLVDEVTPQILLTLGRRRNKR